MQEIKILFNNEKNKHNERGDYINLCDVIKGRNYNLKDIEPAFYELVKDCKPNKKDSLEYINYLCQITLKKK